MTALDKIQASIAKLHGNERDQLAKHADYLAWLKKQGKR